MKQQIGWIVIAVFIALAISPIESWADLTSLDESFSGTGPFSDSNGLFGFDEPGWFSGAAGTGTFQTNGFGEQVFEMSATATATTTKNAYLAQLLGENPGGFSFEIDISNPILEPAVGQIVIDFEAADGLFPVSPHAYFFLSSDGTNFYSGLLHGSDFEGGGINVGNFEQATMRLTYLPGTLVDIINAEIDVNRTGIFQTVHSLEVPSLAADPGPAVR